MSNTNKREIKFRCWSKEEEKMLTLQDCMNCEFVTVQDENTLRSEFESVIVMQYTGLKDKNGVEIYEGDIVAFEDTYTETVDVGVGSVPVAQTQETAWGVVVMKDYGWGLGVQMDCEVIDKGFNSFYEINENFGLEELEIIGNIYENPELTNLK